MVSRGPIEPRPSGRNRHANTPFEDPASFDAGGAAAGRAVAPAPPYGPLSRYPDHKARSASVGAGSLGAGSIGVGTIGALALGSLAIGAIAVGAFAIGRLSVRRARIGDAEIGRLRIHRLQVDDIVPTAASRRWE